MYNVDFKLDAEPKNNYEKALKAMIEADKAMQKLTPIEYYTAIQYFIQYKAVSNYFNSWQQYFR